MGRPKTDEGRATREAILDFLVEYRHEHGYAPQQPDIQRHFGLTNGSLYWHLNSLRDQGFIDYQRGDFGRTLRVTRKQRRFLE